MNNKLICIYTCHKDNHRLNKLKQTDWYKEVISNKEYTVLEVYADPTIDKEYIIDKQKGILTVRTEEEYLKLSMKTYRMIKACVGIGKFNYLVKLDATLIDYPWSLPTLNFNHFLKTFNQPDFYKEYNGIHYWEPPLADCFTAAHEGIKKKLLPKDLSYYSGKCYVVDYNVCKYIAEHGEAVAQTFVDHLDGTEDIMVYLLHRQYKRRKPDFLIVGVQKGGTNSAIHHFNQHKDLCLLNKELHFFDKHYDKGIEHYESQFRSDKKYVGEKTPIYCYDKRATNKIYRNYPDIKLIMFLREPISRSYSQWNMCQHRDDDYPLKNKPFIDCIKEDVTNIANNDYKETDILKRGFYIDQIEHILSKFPKENLYIAISEEVKANPEIEYNKIFNFLGVEPTEISFNPNHHKLEYKSEISKEDALHLYDIYRSYNERLYKLIGEIKDWENYYATLNIRDNMNV